MAEFKVGDRVRFNDQYPFKSIIPIGGEGTITERRGSYWLVRSGRAERLVRDNEIDRVTEHDDSLIALINAVSDYIHTDPMAPTRVHAEHYTALKTAYYEYINA